jgi:hypothetical protein
MYEEPTEALKTADEVLAMIATRIGDVYARPLMYGGTADGVECVLYQLHSLWALAMGRIGEFHRSVSDTCQEVGSDAMGFSTFYRQSHPRATELETAEFVVAQWKRISQHCGVPLTADR